MLQYLEALININNVEHVAIDELATKMRYFHHMLRKERQMLLNNKDWVLTNSPAEGGANNFAVNSAKKQNNPRITCQFADVNAGNEHVYRVNDLLSVTLK